ncbi:MAG: hypothetical protein IJI07_04720 [Flexilinea sp.]|nr:hypothetical protein [Flexilinea sp.]
MDTYFCGCGENNIDGIDVVTINSVQMPDMLIKRGSCNDDDTMGPVLLSQF